ncbi:trace amine-associated receptor 13c-like [Solea solea]|uniref:trace amine-associated receptor 13c-like n=1 Tax=Solea solea TaxID=90069 RepID=UPI00272CA8E6|nr:trace amine-associated receptor 13c-like [Solea solea]
MEDTGAPLLCFPSINSSCLRRLLRPHSETTLLYALVASASLLTVTLNLLVIISISHFRQLHTPTNTLLLSLAVSDLIVGLLVMPIESLHYTEMCWLLGSFMCALAPYMSFCLISVSVGNMVLISIDRYMAICDPLLYSSKITLTKVRISVTICWACSIIYNGLILMDHITWPNRFSSCHGECVVVISHLSGTVDLFVTFVGPCCVMIGLYVRVFVVVVSQVRLIHSHRRRTTTAAAAAAAAANQKKAPTAKISERKAARTLGIVIAVFLISFCPYYYPSFTGQDISYTLSYIAGVSYVMMMNSCINPLIYALFYPWFRKAIKLIVTLEFLKPHCRDIKFL